MFFFFFNFIYLFIYLWLCWVFVSLRGLSLVAASGGHSSLRRVGLSLSWPLLLRSTGSRRAGSVIVAHGPSRLAACGILPDQGSNPCPLHWQADSQPLPHRGSPGVFLYPPVFPQQCPVATCRPVSKSIYSPEHLCDCAARHSDYPAGGFPRRCLLAQPWGEGCGVNTPPESFHAFWLGWVTLKRPAQLGGINTRNKTKWF